MAKSKLDQDLFVKRLTASVDRIFNSPENQKIRDEQNRFLKRYHGEWWSAAEKAEGKSDTYANFVFSTVETVAPLITDNKPIWSVRARDIFMQDYINAHRRAAEYLWDTEDMDAKILEVVKDALIMKIGIAKVYFDPEKNFGGDIALDVIDPRTFFIAPGYSDIWDAPLMGTIELKPISWIRSKFPETGKEVKPDDSDVATDLPDWELHDQTATVYTIWFRDAETEDYYLNEEGEEVKYGDGGEKQTREKYPFGRIIYCTKNIMLGDHKCQYKHNKPPYVALYDYKVPHQFVGKGEVDEMENLNISYNHRLKLIDTWCEYYLDAPWLLDSNSGIDPEAAKEQLKRGGGFFSVNMTMNPEPLKKVQSPNLPASLFNAITGLSKLIEEITGVTDISKGMTTKAQEQSATEISTLIESSYTRTRQRVRNFEYFLKRLYYLVLELQQQFYTEPRSYNYKSPALDGSVVWDTVSNSRESAAATILQTPQPSPEEMAANPELGEQYVKEQEMYREFIEKYGDVDEVYAAFEIEVQTNSTLPMDKQSQANLFLRLLQMASGNPITGMPMWEATLENLRIPKYKETIGKMQELFNKQNQAKGPPGEMPPVELMAGGGR